MFNLSIKFYAFSHVKLTRRTSGGTGQTNGLLVDERGQVTEVGDVRTDKVWNIQKQLCGGEWMYTNLRQVRISLTCYFTNETSAALSSALNSLTRPQGQGRPCPHFSAEDGEAQSSSGALGEEAPGGLTDACRFRNPLSSHEARACLCVHTSRDDRLSPEELGRVLTQSWRLCPTQGPKF